MDLDNDWPTVWSEYGSLFELKGLNYAQAEMLVRARAAEHGQTLDAAADDWKEAVIRAAEAGH